MLADWPAQNPPGRNPPRRKRLPLPKREGEEECTARSSCTSPLPPETGGWRAAGQAGWVLLLCAGCAPRPAPPTDAPNPRLHLTLAVTPRPATSLDPTTFTARVTDAAGQPVSGATAAAWIAMPGMDMGNNQVSLSEKAAGNYTGTGRFTMAGAWRVTVTVSKGADRATQSFDLTAK